MKALYLSPMAFGDNDAVDAVGQGLDHALGEAGIELRTVCTDFRGERFGELGCEAMDGAADAGFDAIVVYAVSPLPFEPGVARARECGVPVFSFARPPYPVDAAVIVPAFEQGIRIAESLADALEPDASVAIIPGPPVAEALEEVMGMAHAVRQRGLTLLNDVADARFHNLSEDRGAADAARAVLEAFPQVDGLLPYNDVTALGAIGVLEEAGRLGQVKMISRNGSPEAIEAVRAGRTYGTWDLDPPEMGRRLAAMVVRHLVDGEPMKGLVELTPLGRLFTLENVEDWKPYAERVPNVPFRMGLGTD